MVKFITHLPLQTTTSCESLEKKDHVTSIAASRCVAMTCSSRVSSAPAVVSLESLGTALASDRCDLASSDGAALTLSSAKRTDFCFLRGLRDDVASRDRMLRVVTKLACDTKSTGGEGSFGAYKKHFR